MVIDRVHQADRKVHDGVVAAGAKLDPLPRMVGRDALFCAGQKRDERGAIGAREIEAVIETAPGEGKPVGRVADFAARDEGPIDSRNGGQEFRATRGDDESDPGTGKFFAHRGDGWSRENEIADPLELDEEDVHSTRAPNPNLTPARSLD